jgi:hypothetical protein
VGTGWRVPHARKGAGPGHSRVPVRARKGALTSGALARVPVRARTHRTSPVPSGLTVWFKFKPNRWIDSVVQIQATEDTVRPLIKRGEHEETPGFQNFAVFCPLCIVRGTGVCRTHIEVGYLVVARGTGWG